MTNDVSQATAVFVLGRTGAKLGYVSVSIREPVLHVDLLLLCRKHKVNLRTSTLREVLSWFAFTAQPHGVDM